MFSGLGLTSDICLINFDSESRKGESIEHFFLDIAEIIDLRGTNSGGTCNGPFNCMT